MEKLTNHYLNERKKLWGFILLVLFSTLPSLIIGQDIQISEVLYNPNSSQSRSYTLYNSSTSNVDISGWWVCNRPAYSSIASATILSGNADLDLEAGESITLSASSSILPNTTAELAIYSSSSFGSAAALIDFIAYGSGSLGSTRANLAVANGLWEQTQASPALYDFIPFGNQGESIIFDCDNGGGGNLTLSSDFSYGAPGSNACGSAICDVDGGVLTGGPFTFTSGDGVADNIPMGGITLTNSQGTNSQWVVTDASGYILGLPPVPSAVNFDGPGAGTCFVYHLSYEDGLAGLAPGESIDNFDGCYSISNGVEVARTVPGDCQANGGILFGGPFTFTAGDGVADNIPMGGITLTNSQGTNSQWVVTDASGYILGLPPVPSAVNFDGPGAGTCFVYHLSYEDGLAGLAPGESIDNFDGCYSISNGVEVARTVPGDCQANGGILFGGPFTFTVSDGTPDLIAPGEITLTNSQGANSQWVVTDDQGYILGLPPVPYVVDFDGAGPGTCFVYHLSYENGLMGLAPGNNINTDFSGCYNLSNGVEVTRIEVGNPTCIPSNFEDAPTGLFADQTTANGTRTTIRWNHYSDYADGCILQGAKSDGVNQTGPLKSVLIQGANINGLPNGYDFSQNLAPDQTFELFDPSTFPNGPITSLDPGQTYMYRVRCGCIVDSNLPLPDRLSTSNTILSPWSDFEFFVNLELPANQFVAQQEFYKSVGQEGKLTVYPNPNDGNFNLNLSEIDEQIQNIEILNISGQVVLQLGNTRLNTVQVDASNLESGIYFVKIETITQQIVEKIIKQ